MQALVNTSVPNGLLAGTHGFATVAMTAGMSERLRRDLEELSAYKHRSVAHDATYERENPVNWSHVVLPSGVHVLSRVACAAFDYTGRTNRLARHLALNANETGGTSGAARLLGAASAFAEPWSGEPRALTDADAQALNRVASVSGASTWQRVFGANGSDWLKRLVWLIVRDNAVGAKPVWFRTDCARDRDGRELLLLFAEVAAALPPALRDALTFSTYAAALPQGLGCLLRGTYDDLKTPGLVFDCRSGEIVSGATLLPTEAQAPRTAPARVAAAAAVPAATAAANRPPTAAPAAAAAATPPPPAFDVDAALNIPPPSKSKGFALLVAAGIVVLLAIGGAIALLLSDSPETDRQRIRERVAEEEAAGATNAPVETASVQPADTDRAADETDGEPEPAVEYMALADVSYDGFETHNDRKDIDLRELYLARSAQRAAIERLLALNRRRMDVRGRMIVVVNNVTNAEQAAIVYGSGNPPNVMSYKTYYPNLVRFVQHEIESLRAGIEDMSAEERTPDGLRVLVNEKVPDGLKISIRISSDWMDL